MADKGSKRRREKNPFREKPTRETRSMMLAAMTQTANANAPAAANACVDAIANTMSAAIAATPKAGERTRKDVFRSPRFHGRRGPNGRMARSATKIGANVMAK